MEIVQVSEEGGLKSAAAESILRNAGEGRVVAVLVARQGERKVRAPQGRVVGNTDRGRPQGKCHRKHTASGCARAESRGKGEKVR